MTTEAYLIGAVRTPHGRFGGSLRGLRAVELGAIAARAALERARVPADAVDEAIVSNCRQAGNGPNPGRQVAIMAGVPQHIPAQTINMACASGLKIIQLAHEAIVAGNADVVLVAAVESMSNMPYLVSPDLRWTGQPRGDISIVEGWRDGGTDPFCGLNMGQTAENIAQRYDVGREAQDEWAHQSHLRCAEAWEAGRFDAQVVPVRHERAELERDETFRADSTPDKLARLRPAFTPEGTVTPGNSSPLTDGAAAMVVASEAAVERHGLTPMGRFREFAAIGVEPAVMGVGPAHAIPAVLERAGLTKEDIDLYEINEAFGAQIVHNVRELELDAEVVNVNGGAIALGHPTGQSGCRLVVTLMHELERRGADRGIASLCVGGGQGVAAVIERAAA